jgi:uncharacterized hydrophobic protein (TIGR00271 family)
MIHLRLIVPSDEVRPVLEHLSSTPGVAHVAHLVGVAASPVGDVVLCDVAREATNDVVEWLQGRDIHRRGAIAIDSLDAVISDSAAAAEAEARGHGADALIWEELEARAREDAALTPSFAILIAIAAVIAGAGILLDSPVLIVGAMVVGPEYGPLGALCVSVVRRRYGSGLRACSTLAVGLALAGLSALVATLLFRFTGLAPDDYAVTERQLTAFISHPDGIGAVVAVLAGIVGMLSLTEARSGSLIGVLVSVTTIPAAANIGVATAYGEWSEVGGAALQLAINVIALIASGAATLAVQARVVATPRRPGRLRRKR